MAEDAENEVVESVSSEMEQTAPEVSIEDQARAVGWKPEGPDSAEVFLRTKPLYDAIKARGKEANELKSTVKELQEHLTKLETVAYKKALAELKAERRAAISIGDVSAVERYDEEIEQIKPSFPEPKIERATKDFVQRNISWINDPSMEAEEMRQWVQKRDAELMPFNLDPEEHFQRLEAELHKKFPSEQEKSVPSKSRVESEQNSASVKSKRKVSFNDLNKEQKAACRHFEQRGIMKAEEYIKQLQELGEL